MAKGKMKQEKDPFEALPEEFRALVDDGTEEECRAAASKTALDQAELMSLKEDDQDLAEKLTASSMAGEVYRDGTKLNKLKIKYIRQTLKSRGRLA
jgi:hypothetical protein